MSVAAVATPAAAPPRRPAEPELSVRVLTIALTLSLWIAFGSVVLATVEGLGEHPVRRLLTGLVLVAGMAALLWRREGVCDRLRVRPWLVVPLGVAQLGAAAADGIVGGPYVQVTLTSIGIASVVARPRTVWLLALALDAGCAAAILAERSPAELAHDGDLAGALGALLGYPFAALVVLGLASLFGYFLGHVDGLLDAARGGRLRMTPALAAAVGDRAGAAVPLLPAPSPFDDLTPDEVRVAEALATGARAKEIALRWGVSVSTIRKHLRLAKRKTGARTLPELAAMTTWPDWPGTGDHAG